MKFCPQCSQFYAKDGTFCPEDGTELKRTQDPYLGRTIAARYRLVKRLGSGGMSNVYLAHHVMIERLSALKILREDLSRQPLHRERFLREARAVNRINHPNIVEISDLGEADGVAYLVMEYIDGPSLHQEIGKGVLPWQRAVRIALQIAAALARAHQMGVVHRDLKPENILLAKDVADRTGLSPLSPPLTLPQDHVKLTDFGIAKILDEPALTIGEKLFGTPGYIAPEYIDGVTTDPRSDIYSLGVILYEMTTGMLPYDGRGAALLTAPLREAPIRPSQRVAAYFADLEALILHLLARDPAKRPPDAFAVYDALVCLLRADAAGAKVGPPLLETTPSATRIVFPAQPAVREQANTLLEAPTTGTVSAVYSRHTSDLTAAAAVGTVRWHEALLELETAIAVAERQGALPERVARSVELSQLARGRVESLERVSRAVGPQQERVDALEDQGRTFRASIGRAIDELVLDRSRAHAHRDAVTGRLSDMSHEPPEERDSDASLWETAALAVESGTSEIAEDDIGFQIAALQRSLHGKNLGLEESLVEASGALEGSLAAIRHLTHEIERLLAEASEQVGEVLPGALPAHGPPAREPEKTGERRWRR